jgi:O-antigen/teichoic acid export membrane protein
MRTDRRFSQEKESHTILRAKLIVRNSLWTALDLGLGIVGGFVLSVLVARVLGPSRLGAYTFVMWIVAVSGSFAIHGVARAAAKFAGELVGRGDRALARAVVERAFLWQVLVGVALVGIGLLVVWIMMAPADRAWSGLAVLSVLAVMIMAIATAANEAAQDLRLNAISSLVANAVHVAGSLVTLWQGWGLLGLTVALLVSRVVDAGLRYVLFRRSWHGVVAGKLTRGLEARLLRFAGLANAILLVDLVVWDRSEVLFLKHFCDIREVAFYSLSFGMLKTVLILPQALTWSTNVNLLVEYGRDPARQGLFAGRVSLLLAIVAFPLAFGLGALSDALFGVLYGSAYLPAIPVLRVVALFAVAQPLIGPVRQLLVAHERLGFLLVWSLMAATLNISLDLLMIPRAGAVGAALANGIAQATAALGLWAYAKRALGFVLPVREIGRVGISAAAMAVAAMASARLLAPLPGVLLGVFVGVVTYPAMLRLTQSLGEDVRDQLLQAGSVLPGRLRSPFARLVGFVAP